MELSVFDGTEKVGRYVKEVTYKLHPILILAFELRQACIEKWNYFTSFYNANDLFF